MASGQALGPLPAPEEGDRLGEGVWGLGFWGLGIGFQGVCEVNVPRVWSLCRVWG